MVVKRKKKSKKHNINPSNIPVEAPETKRVEPAEWYKAKFVDAAVEEGQYGPYLQLNFKLLSGYFEDSEESAKGKPMVAFLNLPINPVGDNATMIKGVTGKSVTEGRDIDLKPHYGKVYKVFVDDKTKKDKTVSQKITKVKQTVKK